MTVMITIDNCVRKLEVPRAITRFKIPALGRKLPREILKVLLFVK